VNDPDPRILALNADLVSYDEIFVRLLRDTEVDFVRMGLGELVNALLISRAPSLGPMNANGCGRMQLNILVLQQNLKNIENDVSLQRAAQYYDLFTAGPEAILAKAKEGKEPKDGKDGKDGEERFEFEELKALVELCFSEQLANPERGVSTVARRTMGECVLQLSEQMWQS
jgi:exocyst complex component 4